jgi:hypothetical protein
MHVLRAAKPSSALIAVMAAQIILVAAFPASGRHLATWHRNEGAVDSFDDLEISNDKTMIDGDRAKGAEAVFRSLH